MAPLDAPPSPARSSSSSRLHAAAPSALPHASPTALTNALAAVASSSSATAAAAATTRKRPSTAVPRASTSSIPIAYAYGAPDIGQPRARRSMNATSASQQGRLGRANDFRERENSAASEIENEDENENGDDEDEVVNIAAARTRITLEVQQTSMRNGVASGGASSRRTGTTVVQPLTLESTSTSSSLHARPSASTAASPSKKRRQEELDRRALGRPRDGGSLDTSVNVANAFNSKMSQGTSGSSSQQQQPGRYSLPELNRVSSRHAVSDGIEASVDEENERVEEEEDGGEEEEDENTLEDSMMLQKKRGEVAVLPQSSRKRKKDGPIDSQQEDNSDGGTSQDSDAVRNNHPKRVRKEGDETAVRSSPRVVRSSIVNRSRCPPPSPSASPSPSPSASPEDDMASNVDADQGIGEVEMDDGDLDDDQAHLSGLASPSNSEPSTAFYLRAKSDSRQFSGSPEFDDPSNAAAASDSSSAFDIQNHQREGSEESIDESGVRGWSYDFSEEERIVIELEKAKAKEDKDARIQAALAASPQVVLHRNRMAEAAASSSASNQGGSEAGGSGLSRRLRRGPGSFPLHEVEEQEHTRQQVQLDEEENHADQSEVTEETAGLLARMFNRFASSAPKELDWRRAVKWLLGTLLAAMLISALSSPLSLLLSSSSTGFVAPDLPPKSLTELVDRLSILEGALGRLSSLSATDRSRIQQDRSRLTKVVEQVTDLDGDLKVGRRLLAKANEIQQNERETEREGMDLLKKELDSMATQVKHLGDQYQVDQSTIDQLKNNIVTVGEEIATLGTNLAQVTKDVAMGAEADRVVKIALAAIESRLPSRLAVRMDPTTGEMEIDPSFWQVLRRAFAEKQDLDRIIDDRLLSAASSSSHITPSASASSSSSSSAGSWDDFLVSNEAALRSWMNADIESRIGSEAIISKRAFLDILRREIKLLKKNFDVTANENFEKIGQELLSKVAKQQQRHNQLAPVQSSAPSDDGSMVKSDDNQNITSLVANLVDSALLRYSKDVLARPDYALFTSGGRVIPYLTSPTYSNQPSPAPSSYLYSLVFGSPPTPIRSPATALHPDTSLGSCWPFSGSFGQLGILLSRRIIPSDISIEHASIDIALDGELASAPKDFELWGVVDAEEDRRRLQAYRDEAAARHEEVTSQGNEDGDDEEEEQQLSMPQTSHHILLAAGSYDVTSPSPIQSFPVTTAARYLAIPIKVVVLKVLSNNGDSRFTCLYRVRISGSMVDQV